MAKKRPESFRSIPIDYRSRTSIANDEWNQYCRRVFPNVPQDVIARPRYYGRTFPLPAEGDDMSHLIGWTRTWLYYACHSLAGFGSFGRGTNLEMRRRFSNCFTRAARWWDSLRSRTLLSLNQSLYPRRDKWKSVEDLPELTISYAFCIAWLAQTKRRKTATEAKTMARSWINEGISAFERGMVINAWGELEPGPNTASAAPTS